MAEETAITKDPQKKRFWTAKNIGGLVFLGVLPLGGSKALDFISHYTTIVERVEDLETEQANNKAIWTAITDMKNTNAERAIEYEVMTRLFDREFARGSGATVARDQADPKALEDVRKLLEEMSKRYHEDHPNVKKLPKVPTTVLREPPVQQAEQMTPQQTPNQLDPATFREQYEKRFPLKKSSKPR